MLAPESGITIATCAGFLEILFPLWLLVRGVNVEKWEKQAQDSVA